MTNEQTEVGQSGNDGAWDADVARACIRGALDVYDAANFASGIAVEWNDGFDSAEARMNVQVAYQEAIERIEVLAASAALIAVDAMNTSAGYEYQEESLQLISAIGRKAWRRASLLNLDGAQVVPGSNELRLEFEPDDEEEAAEVLGHFERISGANDLAPEPPALSRLRGHLRKVSIALEGRAGELHDDSFVGIVESCAARRRSDRPSTAPLAAFFDAAMCIELPELAAGRDPPRLTSIFDSYMDSVNDFTPPRALALGALRALGQDTDRWTNRERQRRKNKKLRAGKAKTQGRK